MQIRGRSGNARKKWVQVFNSPGTIDSDYRGEVGAILYNASDVDFEVNPFDRIAQAVIAPVIQAKWKEKFISKCGREPKDIDIFYAGYILSNSYVRGKYKKLIYKEHESKIN